MMCDQREVGESISALRYRALRSTDGECMIATEEGRRKKNKTDFRRQRGILLGPLSAAPSLYCTLLTHGALLPLPALTDYSCLSEEAELAAHSGFGGAMQKPCVEGVVVDLVTLRTVLQPLSWSTET